MMWQPIETAPKEDDDTILVCDNRVLGGFHQVVFYEESAASPLKGMEDRYHAKDWCWATSDGPTFHKNAFTHWMRLPEPPKP